MNTGDPINEPPQQLSYGTAENNLQKTTFSTRLLYRFFSYGCGSFISLIFVGPFVHTLMTGRPGDSGILILHLMCIFLFGTISVIESIFGLFGNVTAMLFWSSFGLLTYFFIYPLFYFLVLIGLPG